MKVLHGTTAWFDMVGTMMKNAALKAGLSPEISVSLVERYTDGLELSEGLVQGLRFDIHGGRPSYRIGAREDEEADITVEITTSAARTLNTLHSADPNFLIARHRFLETGEMRVVGNLSRLGEWLDLVHDPIVDRTT